MQFCSSISVLIMDAVPQRAFRRPVLLPLSHICRVASDLLKQQKFYFKAV